MSGEEVQSGGEAPPDESQAARPRMPRIDLVKLEEGSSPEGLRTRTYQVQAEKKNYRDQGLVFLLTEMPAEPAG